VTYWVRNPAHHAFQQRKLLRPHLFNLLFGSRLSNIKGRKRIAFELLGT
jgi:hypothetical protein